MGVCLFAFSCEKEDNYMPPKTHEGLNTLGYRLNDTLVGGTLSVRDTVYVDELDRIVIYDWGREPGAQIIKKMPDFDLTLFLMDSTSNANYFLDSIVFRYQHTYYNLDSSGTLDFNVTYLNESDRIIAGTFSCYLIGLVDVYGGGDYWNTLTISDGRFDVRY